MLFRKMRKETQNRKEYLTELAEFVAVLEENLGQSDYKTNWLKLGYDLHKMYFKLVKKYPLIAKESGCEISVSAEERVYSWIDEDFSWHNWDYFRMSQHYSSFIKQEEKHQFYGQYSLSNLGPFGGGLGQPYACCAYLSYAYHENGRWVNTLKALKTLAQ